MREIMNFSAQVQNLFENNQENVNEFIKTMLDASHRTYNLFTREDSNKAIRELFNGISGFDYATASAKERRRDWKKNKDQYFAIIEDVVLDRLQSGWGANPFFDAYVEYRNLALGDKNLFTVKENSLLTVNKFSGNHHDLIRQKLGFGKSFSVDTGWYYIKVYTDYELFRTGRIDFAELIDKVYESVDKFRKDTIYTSFITASKYLPTDLVVETTLVADTKDVVIDLCEEIRAATGYDVAIVGTKPALSKLASTVDYALWSNEMKNKLHNDGELGVWEGYTTITIPRVNEFNSLTAVTDNTQLLIVPISPDFKPVKVVDEGDMELFEQGSAGELMDMTMEAELRFKFGVGVVINMLYGVIKISTTATNPEVKPDPST